MSSSHSLNHNFRHRCFSRSSSLKHFIRAPQQLINNNHHELRSSVFTGTEHVLLTLSYRRYSIKNTISFAGLLQPKVRLHQISAAVTTTPTRQCRCLFSTLQSQFGRPIAPLVERHAATMLAYHRKPMMFAPFEHFSSVSYDCTRKLSTLTDSASNPSAAADTTKKVSDDDKKKSNDSSSSSSKNSNLFLDNLGTMFLLFIASIVGWLVRSYYNGVRKNTVRTTYIESTAHADPIELDELRIANTEFTPAVFDTILQHIIDQRSTPTSSNSFGDSDHHDPTSMLSSSSSEVRMTYPQFIQLVRTAMMKIHGDAFTIQCGHILDRIVLAALIKYSNNNNNHTPKMADEHFNSESEAENSITSCHTSLIDKTTMPIEFWLTVLSLALYSSAKERIEILHKVFHHFASSESNNSDVVTKLISMNQVVKLIGYLQDTCQLVPDAQIIMTSHKYPLQEYVVGTPEQMIDHQQWDTTQGKDDNNKGAKTKSTITDDATTPTLQNKNITVDMLSNILKSRSVCAWGECYKYKSK